MSKFKIGDFVKKPKQKSIGLEIENITKLLDSKEKFQIEYIYNESFENMPDSDHCITIRDLNGCDGCNEDGECTVFGEYEEIIRIDGNYYLPEDLILINKCYVNL